MRLIQTITCLILLLISEKGFGQDINKDNYKLQARKAAEGMKGGLKLSDAQAREVVSIEERFYTELLAPDRDSARLEVRGQKLERLQKQKAAALQKVLTPDQWKQYEAHMVAQKRRNQEAFEERRRKVQEKQSSAKG